MVSKEAKIGLLLGLVFIVAIAVVLRGVHQKNTPSGLGEPLAVNGDIEDSTNNMTSEGLDIPEATKQLTDTWSPASFEESKAADPEESSIKDGEGVEDKDQQTSENQPLWPQGQTRYVQDLFEISQPMPADNMIARIGAQEVRPGGRSYRVQEGDSLWKIAQRELGRGERFIEIQELNNLTNNHILRLGQELKLPGTQSVKAVSSERVSASAAVEEGNMYVVKDGDSLWKIAERELGEGGRYLELASLNNLTENSVLRVGQRLRLPTRGSLRAVSSEISTGPGERIYTVREGDSLWKIAERELGDGLRHTELFSLNNLTENSVLRPGQRLKLPAK